MDARLQRALSSKLLVESASGKYFLVTCSLNSSTSTLFAVQKRALLAALRMQVARKAGSIASIGQIVHDHQSRQSKSSGFDETDFVVTVLTSSPALVCCLSLLAASQVSFCTVHICNGKLTYNYCLQYASSSCTSIVITQTL